MRASAGKAAGKQWSPSYKLYIEVVGGGGGGWTLASGSRTAVQEVQVGQENNRQPFPDPARTAMHKLSPQVNRWRQFLCGVGYRRGVGSRNSAIRHILVHIQLGVMRGKASRVCGPRDGRS